MPTGPRPAPPDDTVRLVFHGGTFGKTMISVMWLALTATSRSTTDLNTICTSIMNNWKTAVQPAMHNQSGVDSLEAIWKTPGGGEIIGGSGASFTGSITTGALEDAAACYLFNWRINAYYRGGHPRTYLGGIPTIVVTNGSDVDGATASAIQGRLLTFLNAVNALTAGGITACQLGTVSFAHANAWRTPPIFRGYTGVAVSPKIATQRRRIGR